MIKKLIQEMQDNGITRISLKEADGFALEIEKKIEIDDRAATYSYLDSTCKKAPISNEKERKKSLETDSHLDAMHSDATHTIESPMVGTFYSAAAPGDPPFVQVGTVVNEETVVCIVEAMKVMNEVKAGKCGEIAEVCVEGGQPVEFGTPLFKIKK